MALIKRVVKNKVYKNQEDFDDFIEKQQVFPDAYACISNITGNKNKLGIQLTIYDNKNKLSILDFKNYSFTPSVADNSENFIRQGYEYLKTLPEFAGAADC